MQIKEFNMNYDVFHAFLVEHADYAGCFELPCIRTSSELPKRIIPFSKAMLRKTVDYNQWVAFYEHDQYFERFWKNPKQYLPKLSRFRGVISPDFSLYRNMPLAMQLWSTYKSRALGSWLNYNNVQVIPNVRWGDERTFDFCFDGIEGNKTVAVGTHGCIKQRDDKFYFKEGLAELVKRLSPEVIVVYGAAPDDIFSEYISSGILVIQFDSEFALSRKRVTV